jgi:hypothetical protein
MLYLTSYIYLIQLRWYAVLSLLITLYIPMKERVLETLRLLHLEDGPPVSLRSGKYTGLVYCSVLAPMITLFLYLTPEL